MRDEVVVEVPSVGKASSTSCGSKKNQSAVLPAGKSSDEVCIGIRMGETSSSALSEIIEGFFTITVGQSPNVDSHWP